MSDNDQEMSHHQVQAEEIENERAWDNDKARDENYQQRQRERSDSLRARDGLPPLPVASDADARRGRRQAGTF